MIRDCIDEFILMALGEKIPDPTGKIPISIHAQFSRRSFKHFIESRMKAGNSREEIEYLLEKAVDVVSCPQLNIPNPKQEKHPESLLLGKYYGESGKAVIVILAKGEGIRDIISLHFKNKREFEKILALDR